MRISETIATAFYAETMAFETPHHAPRDKFAAGEFAKKMLFWGFTFSATIKSTTKMTPIYFSLVLVTVAAGLIYFHIATWKRAKCDKTLQEYERSFQWRQCRRRLQASGMIGLLGLSFAFYPWLKEQGPKVLTYYVLGLLFLTIWVMLLALGDILASRVHLRRVQNEQLKQHKKQKQSSALSDQE